MFYHLCCWWTLYYVIYIPMSTFQFWIAFTLVHLLKNYLLKVRCLLYILKKYPNYFLRYTKPTQNKFGNGFYFHYFEFLIYVICVLYCTCKTTLKLFLNIIYFKNVFEGSTFLVRHISSDSHTRSYHLTNQV